MSEYSAIGIEGPIGAGKTTYARELKSCLDALLPGGLETLLALEPFEKNEFLKLFYSGAVDGPEELRATMRRWGAMTQVDMLSRRHALHQAAQWWCLAGKGPSIMDRTLYGDPCFARMLFLDGLMMDIEYLSYAAQFKNDTATCQLPHVMIRLRVDPEIAAMRAAKRGRNMEVGAVTPAYNAALDLQIEHACDVLKAHGVHVIDDSCDIDRGTPEERRPAIMAQAKRILAIQPPDFFLDINARMSVASHLIGAEQVRRMQIGADHYLVAS